LAVHSTEVALLSAHAHGLLVVGSVLGVVALLAMHRLSSSGRSEAACTGALLLLAGWLLLTAYATLSARYQPWVAPKSYVNLRPFASFTAEPARSTSELVENVALFVPLGALAPFVAGRRRLLVVLGSALVLSAGIECLQYASHDGRFADVDDVILNVAGAVVGWTAWAMSRRWFPRGEPAVEPTIEPQRP
jgi:glycopeptide antibiotics resistance protein